MRWLTILWVLWAATAQAERLLTTAGPTQITVEATGLEAPWGFALLPDSSVLITERGGTLVRASDGVSRNVVGLPEVYARGQGGLLDITLARDFATSRTLFLTYSKPQGRGAGTALAAAELSADGSRLEGLRDLYEMKAGNTGGIHFGSRVVEADDGTLYVTNGDRRQRDLAQDLGTHNGTVVRVTRNGTLPDDNPFGGTPGALPEIWSYGHRNPQGAAFDAKGTLWVVEHGARGGDEVNVIRRGANYGWPVISYGRHYSGAKIGVGTTQPGMEQPAYYWDPSIAPSGMVFYTGRMFPDWRGDILIGSLKFDYISRLEVSGDTAREVEQIKGTVTGRVRDIQMADDGSIWFLSVRDGTLYRMAR